MRKKFRGRSSVGSSMSKLVLICCVCLCCLTLPNPWISQNFKRRSSNSLSHIRNWKIKSIPQYHLPRQPDASPPAAGRRDWILRRRSLFGPGSSPPRCTSKCGRCFPCRPVHVPVPPGTAVTTEYYPEAWRCKCGNRLYMP